MQHIVCHASRSAASSYVIKWGKCVIIHSWYMCVCRLASSLLANIYIVSELSEQTAAHMCGEGPRSRTQGLAMPLRWGMRGRVHFRRNDLLVQCT